MAADAAAASPVPAASPAAPAPSAAAPESVRLQLRAVAGAPLLRKTKFAVGAGEPFAKVLAFLRTQLQLGPSDSLFLYLAGAFAPAPSQLVGDLHRIFSVDGEMVIHYSLTSAYG